MLKQYGYVKLAFTAPLHLSRGRENYDKSLRILHADTLKSALYVASRQCGVDDAEALKLFDSVKISSAFPYSKEEFFFPKPKARLPFKIANIPAERNAKAYKQIQFLGKSWFEKMLRGENADIDVRSHLQDDAYLSDHGKSTIYKSSINQRVSIPPDYVEDATPFFTERLFFEEGSGLYILVEWIDESHKALFEQSFRLLGDMGIGTDRSVGNGFFNPSFGTLELNLPEKASHQCALSLYLPTKDELNPEMLENSAWSLVSRGGYIAGAENVDHITLRKRSVFMFEEGSIFPMKPLTGKRVDLKPAIEGVHSVWRDGRPIFLPINIQ